MVTFPVLRPRRLRRTKLIRDLVAETELRVDEMKIVVINDGCGDLIEIDMNIIRAKGER